MSFNEDAYVPATEISNQSYDREDAYEDDTIADEEGVENRRQAKTPERGAASDFVLAEYEWRSRTDFNTGEVTWFMSVKPSVVEAAIAGAPKFLIRAFNALSDEDKAVGTQIAKDAKSLMETLIAVDQYAGPRVARLLNDQAATTAVRGFRLAVAAQNWAGRLTPGAEEPEKLISMVEGARESARNCAIYGYAYSQLSADPINYKAAAWNVLRYSASKLQERYLNPDELKAKTENSSNATAALIANLL